MSNNNGTQRRPPMIQLETLINVFSCLKRGPIDTVVNGKEIVDSLDSCRKVCRRWAAIIQKHADYLPRNSMGSLEIMIYAQAKISQSFTNNWPQHRECSCYAATDDISKQLVGQLIFPAIGINAIIDFSAGYRSTGDKVTLDVPNLLTLQSARDLIHYTRHLRNTCMDQMWIEADFNRISNDITMNSIVCSALYSVQTKSFNVFNIARTVCDLNCIKQLKPAFSSGFIKAREVKCEVSMTSDTSPEMKELLRFASHERLSNCIEKLSIKISQYLEEGNRHTIVNTIIKHFTTTPIGSAPFSMVEIEFYLSAHWPASIERSHNYNPTGTYTFQLINVPSKKPFSIELFPERYCTQRVRKMRLEF